jgi:hypothetical protein
LIIEGWEVGAMGRGLEAELEGGFGGRAGWILKKAEET